MQFQLADGTLFDTDNPVCPKCGGECWDNRNNKKNPKQPDFRCKDTNCIGDKGYQTGVYLPKATVGAQKPAAKATPVGKPAPVAAARPAPVPGAQKQAGSRGDYGNSVPPSMYGAWAMNLVVALVGKDKVTSVAEGIAAYKEALKGVGDAIEANKKTLDAKAPVPVSQQEKQVAKPVPVQAPEVAPSEELSDPLKDIETELGGTGEITNEDLSNLDL